MINKKNDLLQFLLLMRIVYQIVKLKEVSTYTLYYNLNRLLKLDILLDIKIKIRWIIYCIQNLLKCIYHFSKIVVKLKASKYKYVVFMNMINSKLMLIYHTKTTILEANSHKLMLDIYNYISTFILMI